MKSRIGSLVLVGAASAVEWSDVPVSIRVRAGTCAYTDTNMKANDGKHENRGVDQPAAADTETSLFFLAQKMFTGGTLARMRRLL